jgi:hypothetical protein
MGLCQMPPKGEVGGRELLKSARPAPMVSG